MKNNIGYWSEGEINFKKVIETRGYEVFYEGVSEPRVDITSGYGAFTLGFNNEKLFEGVQKNFNVSFLRGFISETCETEMKLINHIKDKGNWSAVSWAVSGSDAVESAMAMVDQYWHLKEGKARKKVIIFDPCYVGTTMFGKHTRGEYKYFDRVIRIKSPIWSSEEDQEIEENIALEKLIKVLEQDESKEIGSLLMEASPWLNDMHPWSSNFWNKIRQICDKFEILWTIDDVAVCWGKLGTWFSYQHFGSQPDVSAIGKGLTFGYTPMGASVCNSKVFEVLNTASWDHAHTFHPNLWGATASLVGNEIVENHKYFDKVNWINSQLKNIGDEFEIKHRGIGVFRCFDLPKRINPQQLFDSGLVSGIPVQSLVSPGQIKVVAQFICDEEYFDKIKKSLKNLLS
jgi:putrescine aminotransferase